MKYRVTVLTPLLVGDGRALAPIDYMIWKDQVNVLDQDRIFRLLAKGPRLDSYLAQLRRSDKLDFASWGGFAQNYAGRRIPFEDASSSATWQQAPPDQLHIPTFATGLAGPFLPASAIKGALRTPYVFTRWNPGVVKEIANRMETERALRHPGAAAEAMTLGASGSDPMRVASVSDSAPVQRSQFKVYLIRVAALQPRPGNTFETGWKQAPRGTAQRPEQSAPTFAEMAVPGTQFAGEWQEREFLRRPEVSRVLHWKQNHGSGELVNAANVFAEHLLGEQANYAEAAKLAQVQEAVRVLQAELDSVRQTPGACLVNMGWGGGLLSKTAVAGTADEDYRRLIRQLPLYSQAVRTGLPFPKTRKIVFVTNQPATLPGWVRFEIA